MVYDRVVSNTACKVTLELHDPVVAGLPGAQHVVAGDGTHAAELVPTSMPAGPRTLGKDPHRRPQPTPRTPGSARRCATSTRSFRRSPGTRAFLRPFRCALDFGLHRAVLRAAPRAGRDGALRLLSRWWCSPRHRSGRPGRVWRKRPGRQSSSIHLRRKAAAIGDLVRALSMRDAVVPSPAGWNAPATINLQSEERASPPAATWA